MRYLILGAALALAACNQGTVNSASTVAVVSADQSYVTFVQTMQTKVQAGSMTREEFHDKETQAYSALLLFRAGQMTLSTFNNVLNR